MTTITTTTGGIYSVTGNHGAENVTIMNEGRPPGQAGSFSLVLLRLLSACLGGSFHTGSERVFPRSGI